MSPALGELHFFCGKIAAGKSTLAKRLSEPSTTVLISEDAWLSGLFGDQMRTASDYVRFANLLRATMAPHVVSLLQAGVSVVLDFPANTVEQRKWFRDILSLTDAAHSLHLIDAPDALCLARLKERNAGGTHPFAVSETQFHRITQFLVLPEPEEGFNIIRHGPAI